MLGAVRHCKYDLRDLWIVDARASWRTQRTPARSAATVAGVDRIAKSSSESSAKRTFTSRPPGARFRRRLDSTWTKSSRYPPAVPFNPSRRDFIAVTGTLAAAVAFPGCGSRKSSFFSAGERRAIAALADRLIPPDADPGASALGAVEYIERLLTAFDESPAAIYAGGPFSGRQPFGDGLGGVSAERPPNEFARFLDLDRVALWAWKVRLYGSTGVPGGTLNDALIGKQTGLRVTIKKGLAKAAAAATGPLETLDAAALESAWLATAPAFRTAFQQLVIEACFGDPAYGGNKDGAGWKLCHFEGDAQPLGYSVYDATIGGYRERADAPMSTANPGPDPDPLDAETRALLEQVIAFLGGTVFP